MDAGAGGRAAEGRARIGGAGDSLRATLQGMTPADRARPALVNNSLSEGPMALAYRLTNEDTPSALRMLTPNWDFYRASGSRLEVRSVAVYITMAGTCLNARVQPALRQAAENLDWAAVNGLLSRPR
jgi:hypothetical protein